MIKNDKLRYGFDFFVPIFACWNSYICFSKFLYQISCFLANICIEILQKVKTTVSSAQLNCRQISHNNFEQYEKEFLHCSGPV